MRRFMFSAAQLLPFQTPTDLLGVHGTLYWWFAVLQQFIPAYLHSWHFSLRRCLIFLTWKRVVRGERSLQWNSPFCSLAHIWVKYLPWRPAYQRDFLVCCSDTAFFPLWRILGTHECWSRKDPVTHINVCKLSCISEITIHFAVVPPAGQQPQNFLTLNLIPLIPSALDSLFLAI